MKAPVVALETTVITHGLPYPDNIELALNMEQKIKSIGAIPATIGLLKGRIHIGLTEDQLRDLANDPNVRKISSRDYASAIRAGVSGGTTVAGTLVAAHQTGIKVFATGGIGGVHRNAPFDISADLPELSRRPIIVVCAGAKSILDLSATTEYLETIGVPVLGFKTDTFPAFFSQGSKYPVNQRVESIKEIVDIATIHWQLGLPSSILVVVPPPQEVALPFAEVEEKINQALLEGERAGIRGQGVTPFLLSRVSELTEQSSMRTNLGLLVNNADVAARIAVEIAARERTHIL